MYVEVHEHDGDEQILIDNYEIDISNNSLSLGVETAPINFNGERRIATLQLSFRVICARNYFGKDCSRLCTENCTCAPGFSGEFCHIKNSNGRQCSDIDCGANGRCIENSSSSKCECDVGFFGEHCNISCASIGNCSRHGQCKVMEDSRISCSCDPGYTGLECEVELLRSDQNSTCGTSDITCSGNGQCIRNGSSYACICEDGFTGINCSKGKFVE